MIRREAIGATWQQVCGITRFAGVRVAFNWRIFREAGAQWSSHNAPRLGAALAYYTVLSLAPTLLVVVAICGSVFGEDVVRGHLYRDFRGMIGDQGASVVQTLLRAAHRPGNGLAASLIGFVVLFTGASAVFIELRETLNYIWGVPAVGNSGLWNLLRCRFFSFAMVLGAGLVLMIGLAASALIQAAGAYIAPWIAVPEPVLELIDLLVLFLASAFLFALIYKLIPEIRVGWRDVAIGSAITAGLFAVGKFLIGFYLRTAAVGSAYGAAGSLVVVLVWVYYSSQVFLYGAEVTRAYSRHFPARSRTSMRRRQWKGGC
jgi:membrane protein